MDGGAWWATVHGVPESWTQLSDFTFTFHFHALEKEMATHSSVLAWRIPGTGEPGGLLSMGSHRVGHDWSDWAVAAEAHILGRILVIGTLKITNCLVIPDSLTLQEKYVGEWMKSAKISTHPVLRPGYPWLWPSAGCFNALILLCGWTSGDAEWGFHTLSAL